MDLGGDGHKSNMRMHSCNHTWLVLPYCPLNCRIQVPHHRSTHCLSNHSNANARTLRDALPIDLMNGRGSSRGRGNLELNPLFFASRGKSKSRLLSCRPLGNPARTGRGGCPTRATSFQSLIAWVTCPSCSRWT